jgi:DNA polymerase III alpha subunit (gram-positive type)
MNNKEQIYVSCDVETNGPIPGEFSMLSFGAAAFSESGQLVGTFERNLETLPGAGENPDTMAWWQTQAKAWEECRKDPQDPKKAMEEFSKWVKSFNKTPIFVAFPAGFDFTFLYWYLIKFTGYSPFSFSALDIKSYAAAKLGVDYKSVNKKLLKKHWPVVTVHSHVALEDAIEQGQIAVQMLGLK